MCFPEVSSWKARFVSLEIWSVRRPRAWRRGLMQPMWLVVFLHLSPPASGVQIHKSTEPIVRTLKPLFSRGDRWVGRMECTSLSGLTSRTIAADLARFISHSSPPSSPRFKWPFQDSQRLESQNVPTWCNWGLCARGFHERTPPQGTKGSVWFWPLARGYEGEPSQPD